MQNLPREKKEEPADQHEEEDEREEEQDAEVGELGTSPPTLPPPIFVLKDEHLAAWSAEWSVDPALIQAQYDFLASNPSYISPHHCKLFLFCRSKGITEDRFRTLFFEAVERLVTKISTPPMIPRRIPCLPFTAWWLTNPHPLARDAQSTLRELLDPNFVDSEIPVAISLFTFLEKHPEWQDEQKSWLFFRDHPDVKTKTDVLIQRRQLSGNCYIHGPIVAHRYLLHRTNPGPQPTIDVRHFILKSLRMELLSKLITHVGGGSSREIFKMLLEPDSALFSTSCITSICAHLRTLGPGLVTNFNVERYFHTSDVVSYKGKFRTTVDGSHSMVCVGYRKEGESVFLLMQNWWSNKQFLECDEVYFEEAAASMWFSRKNPVTFPTFPCMLTMAEYAEADSDADDLAPEETARNFA